jgi:hypothetical protein
MSGAAQPIESYLAELDRLLGGAARDRHAIVAELRDGLLEAERAHEQRGLEPTAAAAVAVAEFGEPAPLAAAFHLELAARQSRRIALALVTTIPLVGLLWATTAVASHIAHRVTHGDGLWLAGRLGLGLSVATVIATAALIVATTSRLSRQIEIPHRLPSTAAAASLTLTATLDATVLTALAVAMLKAPDAIAWAPALAAASASTARLVLTTRATRRCLTLRRSLA